MDKEPKLPTPMIEPEQVADAILEAAVEPTTRSRSARWRRSTRTIAKLAPALAKKLEAMQADRQQYDEPPRDPEGTLDKPGETGERTDARQRPGAQRRPTKRPLTGLRSPGRILIGTSGWSYLHWRGGLLSGGGARRRRAGLPGARLDPSK